MGSREGKEMNQSKRKGTGTEMGQDTLLLITLQWEIAGRAVEWLEVATGMSNLSDLSEMVSL
jgi:hypothetical protein